MAAYLIRAPSVPGTTDFDAELGVGLEGARARNWSDSLARGLICSVLNERARAKIPIKTGLRPQTSAKSWTNAATERVKLAQDERFERTSAARESHEAPAALEPESSRGLPSASEAE